MLPLQSMQIISKQLHHKRSTFSELHIKS